VRERRGLPGGGNGGSARTIIGYARSGDLCSQRVQIFSPFTGMALLVTFAMSEIIHGKGDNVKHPRPGRLISRGSSPRLSR